MDTTTKHIGNLLARMNDKELNEVFEQLAEKSGLNVLEDDWQLKFIEMISTIIKATSWDYCGNVDNSNDVDYE